jgi:tetratricopeptide (TPR) repeat protein
MELMREADRLLFGSRIEEARDVYTKAAELDPENEAAWYGIGLTWMNAEKWEKAIGYFDKAIALKSDYTDAYYNRGQANFYLGEVYRACEDWQVAYELGKPNMEDKLKRCD